MKRNKYKKLLYSLVYKMCLSFLTLQAYSQDTITVMTHNVLAFSGHPKVTHEIDTTILAKAISYYKNKNIDVLVLQECPAENYVKILADSLNLNYAFFKTKSSGNNTFPYGFSRCIMSKYEIIETFDLNTTKFEIPDTIYQRHLGSVILRTPVGFIQVTGLHLCANWGKKFRENNRMQELDVMLSYVPKCDSCVANIVAGDLNSRPSIYIIK